MSDAIPPTAMQLFAAEFIRELKPLLAELEIGPNPNELLTPYQVARELGIAPKQANRLFDSGAIRMVDDMKRHTSRRELERYTACERRTKNNK